MSSNILSRFNAAAGRAGPPFYEDLRSGLGGGRNHTDAEGYDVEDRVGLALDEENLNEQFHDYDLEHADGLGIDASRVTIESAAPGSIAGGAATSAAAAASSAAGAGKRPAASRGRRGYRNPSHSRWGDDDGDNDDVPGSLLVEPQGPGSDPFPPMLKATPLRTNPSERRSRGPAGAIPSPATKKNRAQWEAIQKQQRLHGHDASGIGGSSREGYGEPPGPVSGRGASNTGSQLGHALLSYFFTSGGGHRKSTAYDRAMWRWVNVSNLDNFIHDVYDYYRDSGIRCILLARLLHLVYVSNKSESLLFGTCLSVLHHC
jgi:autophagy-related protein 9